MTNIITVFWHENGFVVSIARRYIVYVAGLLKSLFVSTAIGYNWSTGKALDCYNRQSKL